MQYTPSQSFELISALFNGRLGAFMGQPLPVLQAALPAVVAEVERTARAEGVPQDRIELAMRRLYGSLRINGQLLFPGL